MKVSERSQDPTEWGFAPCLTPKLVFLPHSHGLYISGLQQVSEKQRSQTGAHNLVDVSL